jgi:heme exporter protein D
VLEAHRYFLLFRDYAAMSILLIIAFGGSGFWFIPSAAIAAIYLLVLVAQSLLARQAARNYGIRLVRDVLANTVHP